MAESCNSPWFKDLKYLSKPDRVQVWDSICTLLQEMEKEKPAQLDNQITPEPATKRHTSLHLMKRRTMLSEFLSATRQSLLLA